MFYFGFIIISSSRGSSSGRWQLLASAVIQFDMLIRLRLCARHKWLAIGPNCCCIVYSARRRFSGFSSRRVSVFNLFFFSFWF